METGEKKLIHTKEMKLVCDVKEKVSTWTCLEKKRKTYENNI